MKIIKLSILFSLILSLNFSLFAQELKNINPEIDKMRLFVLKNKDLNQKWVSALKAKKYPDALEICEEEAEKKDENAYYNLGLIYLGFFNVEFCVEKNYEKAREYYQKASNLGQMRAVNDLGYMYMQGLGGPKDYDKALEYFKKAIQQNDDMAMNNLGWAYQNGFGVAVNYKNAQDWYLKAAKMGNLFSIHNLGNLYYNGIGVEKNYAKALEWYLKAAVQNDPNAYFIIGFMHQYGLGTDKNVSKAKEYYQKAAAMNHKQAKEMLDLLK